MVQRKGRFFGWLMPAPFEYCVTLHTFASCSKREGRPVRETPLAQLEHSECTVRRPIDRHRIAAKSQGRKQGRRRFQTEAPSRW
jgi:hypothetical protein